MNDRKTQILRTAIEIIANQGYARLTMRELARAVGIKLGALQYHFSTSEEMLRALFGYISDAYNRSFLSFSKKKVRSIFATLLTSSWKTKRGRP